MSDPQELDRAIGDPAEWGTPQRGRKSEKRQRDAVISVRMTEAELETVQAKAAQADKTVGTFMRESALQRDVAREAATVLHTQFLVYASNTSPHLDTPVVKPSRAPWNELLRGVTA